MTETDFKFPQAPVESRRRALHRPEHTQSDITPASASHASSSLSSLVNSVVNRHRNTLSEADSESVYQGSQAWSFVSHGSPDRRQPNDFARTWQGSTSTENAQLHPEDEASEEEIEESFLRGSTVPSRALGRESSSGVLEGLLTPLHRFQGAQSEVLQVSSAIAF